MNAIAKFPSATARGATITFLSKGNGGRHTVMRYEVPPGFARVEPHVHANANEWFHVHSGSMEVLIGDVWMTVTAGGYAEVPKGTRHAWRNASDEAPLEILFGFDRPGMDGYFEKIMEMVSTATTWPPADRSALKALAEEYDSVGVGGAPT